MFDPSKRGCGKLPHNRAASGIKIVREVLLENGGGEPRGILTLILLLGRTEL